MSFNLKDNINSITVGIKYDNNFRIADFAGSITDDIIKSDNNYINKENMKEAEQSRKYLVHLLNKKNNGNKIKDDLIITMSEIILNIRSDENEKKADDKIIKNNIEDIVKKYQDTIVKDIMNSYNINNIVRIGIIYNYIIKEKVIIDYIQESISKSLSFYGNKKINDYAIKYTNPKEDNMSAVKRNKDDYYNHIVKIIKDRNKDDKLIISIDFQKYFKPYRTPKKIDLKKHKKEMDDYIKKYLIKWINNIIKTNKKERKK